MIILTTQSKSSNRKHGFILLNHNRFPCVFGRNGLTRRKIEGDGCTPKGCFRTLQVFYRRGKVIRPKTKLPILAIKKNDGWCDDPKDEMYNQHVKIPFDASHENLWRSDNLYNYIVVLDFNHRPIRKGKGSAIFLHVASKNFDPTEGCIAVSENHLLQILTKLDSKSRILVR